MLNLLLLIVIIAVVFLAVVLQDKKQRESVERIKAIKVPHKIEPRDIEEVESVVSRPTIDLPEITSGPVGEARLDTNNKD